jgi:phosphate transport system protein
MPIHFLRDVGRLKRRILDLGSVVEEAVDKAIRAVLERRADLAEEVIRGDDRIDREEVEIEDECLKVMALHHPVAADLRFCVTVLKVNNDLERMGDHAVSIAERAIDLARLDPLPVVFDLRAMGDRVRAMVRESLDALVRLDTALAERVGTEDEAVDELNREAFDRLEGLMQQDGSTIHCAVHVLSASRHLERIADLATNIAEDVVFMVRAQVVRHRHVVPGTAGEAATSPGDGGGPATRRP